MAQAHFTDTEHGGSEHGHSESGSRRLFGGRWRGDQGIWRRGIVLACFAVLLTLTMLFHGHLPNDIGNLGSLTETFLPWLGLIGIPVLLVLGLLRRSATALIALLLPVIVWLNVFGGLLTDKSASGGDLVVATHNVNAANPDPVGTAKKVAASGADVVALEELAAGKVSTYSRALAATYPYHAVEGTVGLWSKYPMSDTEPVNIRLGWVRALRSTVTTPKGKVAFYVAHLPSVRVKLDAGFTASQRDQSADALGAAIRKEPLKDVVLLGDLNGTMNDRSLNAVSAQMRSTQGAAGNGFGFSWPAKFPMARIDQILVKGADPVSSWTLPRTGSDHLPIAARIKLQG
ncbi:endonuclease/exonuclease/phosphatase family protein [Streptomyces sp. NBC_01306]|uniref:endonuclease/exonuclease/phosphatase family protein n=1 Tax=Streptomyces sp. NBC_01306 TaxID=2903819 RepID=UPI00224F1048|nr:endonuclease/exonuclease/phosphatase family protein [Streptomyces sp. NBC_01306]MCX4726958.1 endonuclease/exonuclease/phosphatase family protein [Streptomyces sp. NBC_01306]